MLVAFTRLAICNLILAGQRLFALAVLALATVFTGKPWLALKRLISWELRQISKHSMPSGAVQVGRLATFARIFERLKQIPKPAKRFRKYLYYQFGQLRVCRPQWSAVQVDHQPPITTERTLDQTNGKVGTFTGCAEKVLDDRRIA